MTLQDMIAEVSALSIAERKQLIQVLVDSLTTTEANEQEHSILELEGLGAEIWQDIDAQAYIDQLRSEWDDRP